MLPVRLIRSLTVAALIGTQFPTLSPSLLTQQWHTFTVGKSCPRFALTWHLPCWAKRIQHSHAESTLTHGCSLERGLAPKLGFGPGTRRPDSLRRSC